MRTVKVYRAEDGQQLAGAVEVAASFPQRLRGLLGRSGIAEDSGLLLSGVNGVHSLGMAFPIDVLFLDRDGLILKVVESMPPGRVERAVSGAHSCLELAAGTASRRSLTPGTRLRFGA